MLGLGCLIPGTFGTTPMTLASFVLEAHATTFRQGPAGTAPLSGPYRLGTEFEQGVAIAALPIGEKGGVLGPLHVGSALSWFKRGPRLLQRGSKPRATATVLLSNLQRS